MKIMGAIFDVDGTILDSMKVWMEVGERYLQKKKIIPEPQLGKKLFPMTMKQGAEYLISTYALKNTSEEVIEEILKIVTDFYRYEVLLKDGVEEILKFFRKKGIPCVVATASEQPLIEAAFTRLHILEYFDKIFTCSQVGKGKEDPLIFIESAKWIKCSIGETLVLEDSLHAIQTAKEAGFLTAGIYDEISQNSQEQIINMVDIYGKNFKEIQDKLEKEW